MGRKVVKHYNGYVPPNRSNTRLGGARYKFLPEASLTGKRKHWPLDERHLLLLYVEAYLPRVMDFYKRWSNLNPIEIEWVDVEP